tara:strand:+ start:1636 stop:7488 length:5853 start_codon:yes stop_codon:yes gene_type:complete
MPEIKHTFSAGKMNKDLDERIVQNGEYRDALNIQVRTTDGGSDGLGDSGTVQNLEGNIEKIAAYLTTSTIDADGNTELTKIVGSVADEKNNNAYFFSAAPVPDWGIENINPTFITSEQAWVDNIIEIDIDGNRNEAIFVDRFAVTDTFSNVGATMYNYNGNQTPPYSQIEVTDATKYRIGMIVYAQNNNGDHFLFADSEQTVPGVEIINIENNIITLAAEQNEYLLSEFCTVMKFVHKERVLEFNHKKLITGINVIDDLLFWTDGENEPKKINITRSRKGTTNNYTHTELFVHNNDTNDLSVITNIENLLTADVKKENITVIKKAPTSPPTTYISNTDREGATQFFFSYQFVYPDEYAEISGDAAVPTEGDTRFLTVSQTTGVRVGDVLKIEEMSGSINPVILRARVLEIINNVQGTTTFLLKMIFVDDELADQQPTIWKATIEQKKPFFETKFGRVGYRYQYEDNEYSSFSPWSDLVFLPSSFSYTPSKGFNEGMVNNLRELIIKDFIPNLSRRPADVKCVDILWKTTDNANIYIIKSIKRGIDTEWKNFNDPDSVNTGSMTVMSEMIHRVVEANQMLRSWDNVPRSAIAQEITASRIVYGNYKQGYDINNSFGLKQSLVSDTVNFPIPKKSIKSIRNYKFGAVFGDKYGRETPVIANGYKNESGETVTGDLTVEKSFSGNSNKFKIEQSWDSADPSSLDWIDYVKYYVKETSNEYYNLVLDRWYDAGDGNVWLAFASVDRNKIDERTYLILKNEHGSQKPVTEEARYKIIAISNEAPDYIKTDNRDLEKIRIDRDQVYSGAVGDVSNAIPDKLISATDNKILVNSGNWDDIGIKGKDFKGIIKGRIVGEYTDSVNNNTVVTAHSPWKTVSRIVNKEDDDPENDIRGVVFRDAFINDQVNMYERIIGKLSGTSLSTLVSNIADVDVQSGTYEIKYYLQLRDAVVENKPQFDGRFFVKIEKDDTLENRVLGQSQGNYEIIESFNIAYINNVATNPANADAEEAGSNANFSWPASGVGGFINSTIANNVDFDEDGVEDLPSFGPGDSVNTEGFWNWWYNQGVGGNTTRTTDIFIDNAPAYNDFSLPGYEEQVPETLPSGNLLSLLNCISPLNDGPWPIGSPATSLFPEGSDFTLDDINPASYSNWAPSGLTNGFFANGTKGQLTFSTIGQDFTGIAAIFKSKMQTPGTFFRFKADPNQIVYKVLYVGFGGEPNVYPSPVTSHDKTIVSKNFNNPDSDLYNRYSIIVRFVKVDATGDQIDENVVGGGGIDTDIWDPRGEVQHNGIGGLSIDILERVLPQDLGDNSLATNAACWETEPKEDVGLDIYYEASGAIPLKLRSDNIDLFVSPSKIRKEASKLSVDTRILVTEGLSEEVNISGKPFIYSVYGDDVIHVRHDPNDDGTDTDLVTYNNISIIIDDVVSFTNKNGLANKSKIIDHCDIKFEDSTAVAVPSERFSIINNIIENESQITGINTISYPNATMLEVGMEVRGTGIEKGTFISEIESQSIGGFSTYTISISKPFLTTSDNVSIEFIKITGKFRLDRDVWRYPVELGWFNCYAFGNGVESDRIRDDFNAPQIDNGVKVSSTFLDYGEEVIGSGMIYSGLYNSTSSVNDLNQFNMAEKITKSLNPIYGSIQAMKTRDTNVVVFTEDKVLKVLSNKDAVFNADGDAQLTATNKVLGQSIPFAGDYGISKNPESLAWDSYRMYFTDKQRGAVLRLSGDGLTPISDVGMRTYFRENLKKCTTLLGTFDSVNNEYNVTLDIDTKVNPSLSPITASFNEAGKGWISFKSFIPSTGVSISGKYFTANGYKIYEHYSNLVNRNYFYGQQYESEIEVLFNDIPSSVKSFKAVNYEGSQSKVLQNLQDNEFYNLSSKNGWYVDSFNTDLQQGKISEFIEKEGKWFNKISGLATTVSNLDSSEFSVQGIGFPSTVTATEPVQATLTIGDLADTDPNN